LLTKIFEKIYDRAFDKLCLISYRPYIYCCHSTGEMDSTIIDSTRIDAGCLRDGVD